jgi:nucleotide-binding universal stress UspA family protein
MVSGCDPAKPGNMTTNTYTDRTVRAGSIVVAVDGSTHADQAIARAAEEARLSHRPLALVHVEKPLGGQERGYLAQAGIPLTQVADQIRKDSDELLNRARTQAAVAAPAVEVDAVLLVGDPRERLLELSGQASMIVLGSRGRGPVSSLLLGSVSVAISCHAACPVMVVRPREDNARLRGVLAATNGTSHSTTTLERAFREASSHSLPLTVVYCQWEARPTSGGWRPAHPDDPFYDAARVTVAEVLAGLREKFPDVPVEIEIFAGHADHCVADLSRQYHLTVIGRHAHTLLERVGTFSLTTAVLEHACGPVLVIP